MIIKIYEHTVKAINLKNDEIKNEKTVNTERRLKVRDWEKAHEGFKVLNVEMNPIKVELDDSVLLNMALKKYNEVKDFIKAGE